MKETAVPLLLALALVVGGLGGCGESMDMTDDNPPMPNEPAGQTGGVNPPATDPMGEGTESGSMTSQ